MSLGLAAAVGLMVALGVLFAAILGAGAGFGLRLGLALGLVLGLGMVLGVALVIPLGPRGRRVRRTGPPRRHMAGLTLALFLAGCGEGALPLLTTQVHDWRDEVIYEVVTDRLDNADPQNDRVGAVGPVPGDLARYQGGDWQGITRRLPYLRRLGVTTLWISPIIKNVNRTDNWDGYHGYWAADFTELNPHFGDLTDLRELVRAAHGRGMKVILDVVVNHTGRLFFYDHDRDGDLDPGELYPPFSAGGPMAAPLTWTHPRPRVWRCRDALCESEPEVRTLTDAHFHRRGQATDYLSAEQKELGDFPTGLRDLNTEHPDVLAAMTDTYARWVLLTDVDGFRLDAAPHVPHRFWEAFSRRLREVLAAHGKERFLLLGEAWHTDPRKVASYTREGGLDAVFDFALKWQVVDGFILDGKPADSARFALEEQRGYYAPEGHAGGAGLPPWQARVSFADNHDMRRLRGELNDPLAAELALTLVFTVDAVPCVYYGTEQELWGKGNHQSRERLWDTGFGEDTRAYRHIATLARLRRASAALRRGTLTVRHASKVSARKRAPDAGLLVYERAAKGDRVLVALSGHPIDPATARIRTGFPPGTRLTDALDVLKTPVTVDTEGKVTLTIPPRRAAVLRPAE